MKKITILFTLLCCLLTVKAQPQYYAISSVEDFEQIRMYASEWSYFYLTNDIEAYDLETIEHFRGFFDGAGFTLKTTKPLFRNNHGTIVGLGIIIEYDGDYIENTWGDSFGAIACNNYNTALEDPLSSLEVIRSCHVYGIIKNAGTGTIGGIVGTNYGGFITLSESHVRISSEGTNVGGIAGYNCNTTDGSKIENCHAHGTIIGKKNVGGVLGKSDDLLATVNQSGSYAMIYGEENVGGFIGYSNNLTIGGCYAQGIVKGKKNIGGFFGYALNGLIDKPSYHAVMVDNTEVTDNSYGLLMGNTERDNHMEISEPFRIDSQINQEYNPDNIMCGGEEEFFWYYGGKVILMTSRGLISSSIDGFYGSSTRYPHPYMHGAANYLDRFKLHSSWKNTLINPECFYFDFEENSFLHIYGIFFIWGRIVYEGLLDNYKNCNVFAIPEPENPFHSGVGTQNYPYIIKTVEHLRHIGDEQYRNKHYRIEADIEAYDMPSLENFSGVLDGKEHILYLNKPLFINITRNSHITNLGILIKHVGGGPESTVEGGSFGAIACNMFDNARISRCFVAGTITNMGKGQIGGMVGIMYSSTISDSKAYVCIDSNGEDVGGIAGYVASPFKFENCYVHGTIKGETNVGGLVGRSSFTDQITNCASYTMVYGKENVGGLIGYSRYYLHLRSCYTHGVVKGHKYIGSIAGYAERMNTYPGSFPSYCAMMVDARNAEEATAGLGTGYTTEVGLVYYDITMGRSIQRDLMPFGNFPDPLGNLYQPGQLIQYFSTVWNAFETFQGARGYPIFENNPEIDSWKGFADVKDYLLSEKPDLINSLVKWECFAQERYTSWTELLYTGAYMAYVHRNCDIFDISEPEVPCYAGRGTAADPYQISTPEQLDCMMDYLTENNSTSKHFRIMNDIDMGDYLSANYLSAGWRGNEVADFNGYLHGGGHIISGIWMNHTTSNTVGGLFAGTGTGAVIDSLGIILHSRGIYALGGTGGLVGHNRGEINSCFTAGGNIITFNDDAGTGGLVGYNNGSIENCYSTCGVIASSSAYVGGLVGYNITPGNIYYTYAAGIISGGTNTGGLAGGNNNGAIRYCYYDKERTFQQKGIGEDIPGTQNRNVFDNTTAQMKDEIWLEDLDFDNIWRLIPNYYPILQWQKAETAPFSLILPAEFVQEIDLGINIPVKIYPNPTTGIVHIETSQQNPEITVYDLNGAVIFKTSQQTIDMTSYPKGMYILNINGKMEKLIKQ